jgi:NADH:ubiquinone oxidoreductase subunit F (NADH-binding)
MRDGVHATTPTPRRLLAGADPSGRAAPLEAHRQAYGPLPDWTPRQLIAEVERSGLRGRGGADFPTARKLATVAASRSVSAVVVNGSETEPASAKDRVLMGAVPHLVLDGAALAAAAVGADEVIFVLGPKSRGVRVIARFGARWFRSVGTPADPGTVLTTLRGPVSEPGVYEIAFGTPLTELIAAAGGTTEPARAVLVGGYFGTWADAVTARRMLLAREHLRAHGHALGAGVVIVRGHRDCVLHDTAALLYYLAGQSAGQCGPCVYGLQAIAEAFADLVDGYGGSELRQQIERWTWQVDGRGACHHPNGVARLVRSALATFAQELVGHDRRCSARVSRLPGLVET